jgi:ketosteroid isomerase-like protein
MYQLHRKAGAVAPRWPARGRGFAYEKIPGGPSFAAPMRGSFVSSRDFFNQKGTEMPKFHDCMKTLRSLIAIALFAVGCSASKTDVGSKNDRDALEKTSEAIRAAFARGDVATILAYHHPDVLKGLSYGKSIDGRDALEADLTGTLQRFSLEWQENRVESTLFQGDTAVELTVFTIKGTPRNGGEPFLFKGRAMVVYVRYKKSPTGWASIRELIQPAT